VTHHESAPEHATASEEYSEKVPRGCVTRLLAKVIRATIPNVAN
jgi:hypothetical protein